MHQVIPLFEKNGSVDKQHVLVSGILVISVLMEESVGIHC